MTITPLCTPPGAPEIEARRARAQSAMSAQGLDALVLHSPANVYYLTNFANYVHERPFILVLFPTGDPVFVMPKLEEPHVRIRSVGPLEIAPYFEFPAPEGQAWDSVVGDLIAGKARIGIEPDSPYHLVEALAGRHVKTEIVEDLRAIKSSWEISRHQYACDMFMLGMDEVLKQARPGALPIQIYSAAAAKMNGKMFADLPSTNLFATSLRAAPQPQPLTHDPHNFTDFFVPLAEGGPHVALSAGLANGYGGEVERTFFIGHVPEVAKRPFEVMIKARALANDLSKPGALMHDVDAAVNGFLRKAGYGDNLLHRTGHGIGVTAHEGPFLAEGDHRELKPGMVFTIEPGIYLQGIGGFRHSDTVLITETGNRNMTPWPDTIEALTLSV